MSIAPIPPLAAEFGYQLGHAARRWRRALDEALASEDLTEAMWRPLVHLARLGDGARQNDLARSLGIEGPSLVRLLDRLEAAGLVARSEDPTDRRAKALRLTPEGAALTDRLQATVRTVCAELTEGVSPAELEACLSVFARMAEQADRRGRP